MGLAALARGERRMMPLGMVPYLLWPTRTALQARRRDRLARDLRHHLQCTVGVLYGCGTTRATRGAPSAAAGRRRSSPTPAPARPRARCHPGGRPHRGSTTTSTRGQLADCDNCLCGRHCRAGTLGEMRGMRLSVSRDEYRVVWRKSGIQNRDQKTAIAG